MSAIVIPDNVPLDQALDLVLRHGLRYDHRARRLLPRIPNPGAGRASEPATTADGSALQHRSAPASTAEE